MEICKENLSQSREVDGGRRILSTSREYWGGQCGQSIRESGKSKENEKKGCWEEAEDLTGLGIKAPEFILSSLGGYLRALREVKWLKNNKYN